MMQHPTNQQLIDYAHNQLSPAADATLHAHLADCARCCSAYAAEVQLGEELRAKAERETYELPPMLKAHIWAAVRETRPRGLSAWLRPIVALPLAAAAALLIAFVAPRFLSQPAAAPTIDAAYYVQDHEALGSTVPFTDHASRVPVEMETGTYDGPIISAIDVGTGIITTADARR